MINHDCVNSSSNDYIKEKSTEANDPIKANNHVEEHPFEPVLPPNATIMMMGTMPPTSDKWRMNFHYPNFQNDMWRIYGRVFFENAEYFIDSQRQDGKHGFDPKRIEAFLHERGIASCPTVKKAIREQGNAADKFLTIVEAVNLHEILAKVPKVTTIFTTGGKATEILMELLAKELNISIPKSKMPKTNQCIDYPFLSNIEGGRHLTLYRLPSTSRAYPLSLDKKVAAYLKFFNKVDKI